MPILRKNDRDLPDEKLMELIQQGRPANGAAFDELYNRYSRRLLFYFHRMLGGNTEKAQDFLQDLFLKIVEQPNLFRAGQRFRNWVYAIAHNLCKNEYRRLEVRKIIDHQAEVDSISSPAVNESESLARELDLQAFKAAVIRELEKVNANHRTTFLLRHQEGLSIREISEILDCSLGTTKSRLFYTTKKLAKELQRIFIQGEVS